MKMRLLCGILFLPALTASAAEEFEDSVPLDLAEMLLSSFNRPATLYRDIPVGFPEFTMPGIFEIIGGLGTDYNNRIILRTSTDREEALQLLGESLEAEGWIKLPQVGNTGVGQGFISARPPVPPETYCHDEFEYISVNPIEDEDSSFFSLSNTRNLNPRERNCAEEVTLRESSFGIRRRGPEWMDMAERMPRLVLPEEADTGQRRPGGTGGTSGSRNEMTNSTTLSIPWSPGQLEDYFAAQLEEQGWSLDSQWSGDRAAGSAWIGESGEELISLLTIVNTGGDDYSLSLRLIQED